MRTIGCKLMIIMAIVALVIVPTVTSDALVTGILWIAPRLNWSLVEDPTPATSELRQQAQEEYEKRVLEQVNSLGDSDSPSAKEARKIVYKALHTPEGTERQEKMYQAYRMALSPPAQ